MRQAWMIVFAGLVLLASAAQGQLRWGRRYGSYAPIEQRVDAALSLERAPGMDDWAWRDAVEGQLTALGNEALPLIARAAEERNGYAADAARVALFRIDNRINPAAAAAEWAQQQQLAEVQVRRIMGLREMLPHHLFYVVEFALQAGTSARQRRVMAVAADTKVQVLPDDAALGRFLGIELAPAQVEAVQENVAELACRIAAARYADVYEVNAMQKSATALQAQAAMMAGSLSGHAEVLFSRDGRVTGLRTEFAGAITPGGQGAKLPEHKTAPAMPE